MISGGWDYSAQIISKWQNSEQSEKRIQKQQLHSLTGSHETHTSTIPPFFSVYRKGPRPPISTITYFVHSNVQNNWGKDTFFERFVRALKEAGAQHPGPSLAPPAPLWLHWPQRQLLPVSDLLASPLSPPPTGERRLDTSASTPARPRTGLHSLTPWHPPCCSGSRKRRPSTAPHKGLWPSPQGTGNFGWCLHSAESVDAPRMDAWGRQPPVARCFEFHCRLWSQIWFDPSLPADSRSWCSGGGLTRSWWSFNLSPAHWLWSPKAYCVIILSAWAGLSFLYNSFLNCTLSLAEDGLSILLMYKFLLKVTVWQIMTISIHPILNF